MRLMQPSQRCAELRGAASDDVSYSFQVREDRLVNVVLAEQSLILSEAKAPQPDHDVHDSAPTPAFLHIIVRSGESVQEAPR